MTYLPTPPLNTLSRFEDRWTPIYLEHGRLDGRKNTGLLDGFLR